MASPAHSAMSDRPWVNTLISRGCSCRHAIVLKGHEKINLQCKCHIIETEHEANSGKPRKHIRSRKDGRYAGMANSGIPSCCLALLDQVSSKTPGPPAMWNFRPCSRTLHTHTHTHTEPQLGRSRKGERRLERGETKPQLRQKCVNGANACEHKGVLRGACQVAS